MQELVKAVLSVMNEITGIDKSLVVGTGMMSYKGVSDKDVKKIIGNAMSKFGLIILPIGIHSEIKISDWEETSQYGVKRKQNVFTEVNTRYLLMHESGQSIEISGYGQGVDSQDKGAGKATTYALKYALLYTFLVPTGQIDDADKTHSEDIVIPKMPIAVKKPQINNERFEKALEKVKIGEYDLKSLKATFELSPEQLKIVAKLEKTKNIKTDGKNEQ